MKQKLHLVRIIALISFLTLAAPALLSPVFAAPSDNMDPADPAFVNSLSEELDATGGADCPEGFECRAGIAFPETGLPDTPIEEILLNFMRWLFGIFGFLAIITFLIAGIQYFMAAGDPDSAKRAKKNVIYSIVGILVALSGYVIITAIANFLNADPYF